MKKIVLMICILVSILCLTACSEQPKDPENLYQVYYLSNSETKVENHEYELQSQGQEEQVKEMLLVLQTNPGNLKFKAPLAMGFGLKDYSVKNGKVTLDVSAEYHNLSVTQETLVRAAVVKSLTQISGINFVSITVEGEPLKDALGKTVGWMNRDEFIENEGEEINAYQEVELKLYFANEEGTGLLEATRTIEYNTNIPIEKLIVEQIIMGPNAAGIFATVNPQTKVASVNVQDGICYVNLDESFLTPTSNVSAEVTIYSIVNSLVKLNHIQKVQFSINGDSTLVYREKFPLNVYYERNLDLVLNSK